MFLSGDCDLMKLLVIKQLQKLFHYGMIAALEDARDSGELVPLLNEILGREDSSALKSEAAKAVIDSIPELLELTDLVIKNKLVETLLKLLHFPDGNVYQQAVEKLGKVAQSVVGRDYALIECGAIDDLLEILNSTNEVKPAFPTLRNLLTSNVDEEVLKNACWALYYLSAGVDLTSNGYCTRLTFIPHPVVSDSDMIKAFFQADVLPVLLNLFKDDVRSVIRPAINTVVCISVLGDQHQKEMLIDSWSIAKRNVLDCLLGLLKSGIEEEMVCMFIAYITIGSMHRAKGEKLLFLPVL
ncbi:importin subunit alpha-1a-like isoform X2 [Nicotiana tabacum]|uniref:Importin subunit alpha-1-like isoform X2 n=3 Tax=Nicotiana TaxID=4085 RepID=A0A1S3ZY35_TOBAC|nr:PREDICTED: importin subunit alpha-1-like isoform X2 [Nicotiana sylvestris]XP_016469360.1 PREDICTED: importin subunit alpha-1-like isoform X2 [Nicotiana tabacum]